MRREVKTEVDIDAVSDEWEHEHLDGPRIHRIEEVPLLEDAGGTDIEWVVDGIFAQGALHMLEPQLLTDRSGKKTPDRMGQPARGFHQILGCDSARPLQQVQDPGGLAAVASLGFGRRSHLGSLRAFGSFLGGAGLLARLGLSGRNGRATSRTGGLLFEFRRLASVRGGGGVGFFGDRLHFQFLLFAVDYRGHDMDHSSWPKTQGKFERSLERRWNGDEAQMSSGVLR